VFTFQFIVSTTSVFGLTATGVGVTIFATTLVATRFVLITAFTCGCVTWAGVDSKIVKEYITVESVCLQGLSFVGQYLTHHKILFPNSLGTENIPTCYHSPILREYPCNFSPTNTSKSEKA
ncbi:MAG: hypothetical protein UR96_C0036G0005, partial [candidate division WS6 bacterium GW2011_GWC1_36_11]